MSNAIAQSRNPVIENLKEYLWLKEVHANTALIGGNIFFDGKYWPEAVYNMVYPLPILCYKIENPDKKNVPK